MSTEVGTRAYFIEAFSDETTPCETTLEGWANWLATPDLDSYIWQEVDYPIDGSTYTGSAILWSEDIVATPHEGRWRLSREPVEGEDFFAIRWDRGAGWSAEDIVYTGEHSSVALDIIMHLVDVSGGPDDDDDVYQIATGRNEQGWRFVFHEGPPASLSAERVQ